MIPKLFSSQATTWTSEGRGRLTETIKAQVFQKLNGEYTATLSYPYGEGVGTQIEVGSVIVMSPEYGKDPEPFLVKDLTKNMNGTATVKLQHWSYLLSLIPVMPFTATTCLQALQGLVNNSAETNNFIVETDKSVSATYRQTVPASFRSRLGGTAGSILDVYGGEYEFNGWKVKLHTRRGSDRGVEVRYGKNLIDLKQEQSIANTITGICPYWAKEIDGEMVTVTLPERVIESEYTSRYAYPRTVVQDFSDQFENEPTEEELRGAAQTYVAEHASGVPAVNWTVKLVELRGTDAYQNVAQLERVNLGDTVRVVFADLGVNGSARVIATKWNPIDEQYDEITLGNVKASLADKILAIKTDTEEQVTRITSTMSEAISNATQSITGNRGGHVVFKLNENNQPEEIYIMDTDDVNTAVNVWRYNAAGWGASSNGINGPYSIAATLDGGIVADYITSGTMSTDRIVNNGRNLTTIIEIVDSNASRLDGAEEDLSTMQKWFTFSSQGFRISETDSALSTLFTNSDIQFMDSGVVTAYINGQKFYINIGEIIAKLLFRHGANGTTAVAASVNANNHWILKGDS